MHSIQLTDEQKEDLLFILTRHLTGLLSIVPRSPKHEERLEEEYKRASIIRQIVEQS